MLTQTLSDKKSLVREYFVDKVLASDESVKSFTGLPSTEMFDTVNDIASENAKNLKYWKTQQSLNEKQYQKNVNSKKPGPSRILTNKQELLITLMRLRLAIPLNLMSVIFGVSKSMISSIFTTWIFYLYFLFNDQISWPTKELVQKHMPLSFKRSFPNTHGIIDCTEIFIQRPRNPSNHSKTYSNYKSHNTFKFLVCITPTGAISFVSDIWGGNTSDRYITANSGFLDYIEPGIEIMADRGFTIRDLLTSKGAYLTIPPFTRKCNWGKGKRLNSSEIKRTKKIANLRVHVERAIQRMKCFKFLSEMIPWSMKSVVNPMIKVVSFLCNLQKPLVTK